MKKQLLTVLICAGLSLSVFAETIFYGKANVSYQIVDEDYFGGGGNVGESTTEVKSNASRIGVKGSLKIEGGIEAIYQAEFEVQFDDGDDKNGETFSQRDIFVGLKGRLGTVKVGKFDTPLKVAQNKVDLFNDLEGDIKYIITEHDNRADNIISYQSPEFGSFIATAALISSEEDGVEDGVSASIAYDQNGLYLAAALDQDVEGEDVDVLRFVAQYNFSVFQVGGLLESVDNASGEDTEAVFVSFQYTIDKLALKAQFGLSDINEDDGQSLSFGVDYKLAEQLKVFSYYTRNESDHVARGAFEGSADDGRDDSYLGVGVELKF